MKWLEIKSMKKIKYKCGYCELTVAPSEGYYSDVYPGGRDYIAICPNCSKPTYFNGIQSQQTPVPVYGNKISNITDKQVEALYNEARRCFKEEAYTSIALLGRKILMHIAVEKGAKENQKFFYYVDYLVETNWVPPNGKNLVDKIKDIGNEANHEIIVYDRPRAEILIRFVELLLTFVYGFEIENA